MNVTELPLVVENATRQNFELSGTEQNRHPWLFGEIPENAIRGLGFFETADGSSCN